MQHRLTMLHPIDPRGSKVGGIETHVRLMFERHPPDFSVLLVGVDERGDLELGKVVKLPVGDHTIDFLPSCIFRTGKSTARPRSSGNR